MEPGEPLAGRRGRFAVIWWQRVTECQEIPTDIPKSFLSWQGAQREEGFSTFLPLCSLEKGGNFYLFSFVLNVPRIPQPSLPGQELVVSWPKINNFSQLDL